VEPATARDTEADVEAAIKELHHKYMWVAIGPEGKEIQAVLKDVAPGDEYAALVAWEAYLWKELTFPFHAAIAEFQEHGPLRAGDKVVVRRIVEIHNFQGILVEIQSQYGIGIFPLCDLEVAKKRSPMHHKLRAYTVWYANR
jgi:hypothetical protein